MLATGHYVASRRRRPRRPRALSRRRSRARPELFPVRHHPRAARRCCASRSAGCRSRRCGRSRGEFGLAVADKPDSQDICFVPDGPLQRHDRAAAAGRRGSRRHRPCRRPRARPPRRHPALHDRPAARPRRRRRRAAVRRRARRRAPRASSSARARRWRPVASSLRDFNWIGDGELARYARRRPGDRARACARPARRRRRVCCRAARSSSTSRNGVSPGQACVLYDSLEPARACWAAASSPVTGGGR